MRRYCRSHRFLGRYWKRHTSLAVAGAGLTIWSADRGYTIMKAFSCDVSDSSLVKPEYKIQRDNVVNLVQKRMDHVKNCFVVVSGHPGTGKTSVVLDAARRRGTGVVYINAEIDNTTAKIKQKLIDKFSLSSFLRFLRIQNSPEWKAAEVVSQAARWYSFMNDFFHLGRRNLVVIIDHLDKLEPYEIPRLLGFLKSAANNSKLTIWLIGTDPGLNALRKTSDYVTRGFDLEIPPPTADEIMPIFFATLTRAGLSKYSEELLYLVGRNPAFAWTAAMALLHASEVSTKANILDQLRQDMWKKMKTIDKGYFGLSINRSFWSKLIEAGSDGVPIDSSMVDHQCVTCDGKLLHFRNGLCRDFYIDRLEGKVWPSNIRKYSAYAPREDWAWSPKGYSTNLI